MGSLRELSEEKAVKVTAKAGKRFNVHSAKIMPFLDYSSTPVSNQSRHSSLRQFPFYFFLSDFH